MARTVYTIGHSTHAAAEFVAILRAYAVSVVVDVRTIPKSRHNPQFGAAALEEYLGACGIGYTHLAALGGLRRTSVASPNTGWKNRSFRGYADYMQTPEFARGLEELMTINEEHTTVIMCAEAVPWRCHRSLIGDALVVRNMTVIDILSETNSRPHVLTPFAEVHGDTITYPGD